MDEQNKYLFAVPFYLELVEQPEEEGYDDPELEDNVPLLSIEEPRRILREKDEYGIFSRCAQVASEDWNLSEMHKHFYVSLAHRNLPIQIGMYRSRKNPRANYVLIQFIFDGLPLYKNDVELIKNWIEGQMSDGWGESFEQNSININKDEMEEIEVYMHLWWGNTDKKLGLYDIQFIKGELQDSHQDDGLAEAYDPEQIAIANKTSRSGGASALGPDGKIRSVVARWVMEHIDKASSILDFGAGSQAIQTQALRDAGFKNVTAYDFGSNVKDGLHDPEALNKTYEVVFASNVINTASSKEMIIETIKDILRATEHDGISIFNYPATPRKTGMTSSQLKSFIQDTLGVWLILVGGTNSTPIWKIEV